jgi:predicted nucleic-acid-binding protein
LKISADTNVLVRALIEDDPKQSSIAQKTLKSADVVALSTVALCELVWVLQKGYSVDSARIADAILRLTQSENVVFNAIHVNAGLTMLAAGGDFADGVIASEGAYMGAEEFVSFDKKCIKRLQTSRVAARLLA